MAEQQKAAAEPPVARIVNMEGRSKRIPLQYAVEFDGAVWEDIEIRRCTGEEIAHYVGAMAPGGDFVLPPVIQCPVEVWNAMDADDQFAVDDAARDFMPRRLKAAVELLSETGANTSGK